MKRLHHYLALAPLLSLQTLVLSWHKLLTAAGYRLRKHHSHRSGSDLGSSAHAPGRCWRSTGRDSRSEYRFAVLPVAQTVTLQVPCVGNANLITKCHSAKPSHANEEPTMPADPMKMRRYFTTILHGLLASSLVSGMAHAGTLTATHTSMPEGSIVNLSEEGLLDWVHWGTRGASSGDHDFMTGVDPQISKYTRIGIGAVLMFNNNFTGYSWTNGTPTLRATNSTTGIFVAGKGNGFEISVPADTTPKLLKVHVGAYGAQMHLEAAMSDQSAPPYVDESYQNLWLGPNRVYAFQFAANAPGAMLRVRFWTITMYEAKFGNITLQSATLNRLPAIDPPALKDGSITLTWPAGSELETATAVHGPWTPTGNQSGSLTEPVSENGGKFYRLKP